MDINSLNLKKFEEYGAKISRKISVNKSFSLGFPPTLCKEEELLKFDHVILYFDVSQEVIGIRFVQHENEGEGFKINEYGEGNKRGASIIARSFFNKYNIDPKRYYGKYEFKKITNDEGEIYLIQLKPRASAEAFH